MRKDAQVPSVVPSVAPSVAPSVVPSVGVRPRVHARGIWSKGGFFGGGRRFLNKESPLCCYLGLPRSAGLMARVAWISLLSAPTKSTGLSRVWCCPGLWCKWGLFHCTWRVIWQLLWIGSTEKGEETLDSLLLWRFIQSGGFNGLWLCTRLWSTQGEIRA